MTNFKRNDFKHMQIYFQIRVLILKLPLEYFPFDEIV